MSLNFNYTCRLCLKQNGVLLSIFSENNGESLPTLPAKIQSFAPTLKIFAGDGLPDHVCQQCASQVNTTYKFKLQCESSDAILRDSLVTHSPQNSCHEVYLTVLESGNDNESRNISSIKHEVKEEIFVEESHFHSDNNEDQRISNDELTDNSSNSWTDIHSKPSSSKLIIKNIGPKKKQSSSRKIMKNGKKQDIHKVTARSRKKIEKDSHSVGEKNIKNVSEETTFGINNEAISKNCVKSDGTDNISGDMKNETVIKVKKRVKKSYMKLFHCHDCGKNFAKKTQLVLHMSGHTGAKPFICSQCGRTFASRINLKKHLFTHTGEKPYLCTRCGISFGRIDTLTKHMRSHTGEKPFHCTVCGNNFARRSTFTNHMRTHSGEKPYLCTECGWRCVQSYDLKKHMRCHSGEKPFRCNVCRMSFGQRNSLSKHMRCHIGEVPIIPLECTKELQYRCQV